MLQQTRVTAVVEYYKRFLDAFPDVTALATAPESAILAQWSGLGYYRRARMLHAAAKEVAIARKKHFPRTSEEWQALPGIGRYTAAAIASIAFGEPVAVVDGNVERVLRRLLGKAEKAKLDAWGWAGSLLDARRPGDFNQAMMELGATVCLPKGPACARCPVREWCKTQGEHRTAKTAARKRAVVRLALKEQNGRVLLVQRDERASLMPGMWELPPGNGGRELMRVRHSVTDTDFSVRVTATSAACDASWVSASRLAEYPLTGLARKVLRGAGILR